MKRYIVIEYDPDTCDGGDPCNLFDQLVNELDSAHIQAKVTEHAKDPREKR